MSIITNLNKKSIFYADSGLSDVQHGFMSLYHIGNIYRSNEYVSLTVRMPSTGHNYSNLSQNLISVRSNANY